MSTRFSLSPPRLARAVFFCLFVAVTLGFTPLAFGASNFTNLYTFQYGNGERPEAALVLGTDGDFYGTASAGGANGTGTVFKVTPGGTLTTIYTFSAGTPLAGSMHVPNVTNPDGASPQAALVLGSDGDFYGMTSNGGLNGSGTIFKITPGGTLTTLHTFSAVSPSSSNENSDGGYPEAALILGPDGDFYGMASAGGAYGTGTVFKITPNGTFTTLHNFTTTNGNGANSDGADPQSTLVLGTDGAFYGTTGGGGANGTGTVFKITTTGTLTTLYSFSAQSTNSFPPDNSDGISPNTLVLGSDGNFYGTAREGGTGGAGTVFKIAPNGAFTLLHTFSFVGSGGADPAASLVSGPGGSFYGTTSGGGTNDGGTVFSITPTGTLATLAELTGAVSGALVLSSAALVVGSDGSFYGATQAGGANNAGQIYKITPAGTLTGLYSFVSSNGVFPGASLVAGPDGNLYGTVGFGGANGDGTVFKITPSGALTTLYTFSATSTTFPYTNSDGADPIAALVLGPNGDFYGTTSSGGANGEGAVFKITPSGALTTLYSFSATSTASPYANSDGARPSAALVLGPDGNLYGTAEQGGANGSGTVFKITSTGTLTTLHAFSGSEGQYPSVALVIGSDGNFYGTTSLGGTNGDGTIFKITPGGTLATLVNFTGSADGAYPVAALVLGPDGNFYGTASGGGAHGIGTVFKMTLGGTLTTLYSFMGGTDGGSPVGLAAASNGEFYGMTDDAIGNSHCTIFEITPSGTLTTLYTFAGSNGDDPYPDGALVLGLDGNFYGTTQYGGSNSAGTVFSIAARNWTAVAAGAGPNGTGRILWNRSDGAAGLWALGPNDTTDAVGPTYGSYAGWTAKAVATASDGTSRVLWTNVNGQAGVWTFNASGVETTIGTTYGPYAGWTAQAVGVAGDGTSRVLWTNTNGMAGVWSFGANDVETIIGPVYGPISGWSAVSLATASDGTSRILWTSVSGTAGVWSFGANDTASVIGSVYGPYPGWIAKAVGAASDGTSRVLWTNTNGMAGVWSFNASDIETVIGPTYGPYPGYGAVALGVSADGTSRVLWTNVSGTAGVWSFGADAAESVIGSVYGPF